MHLSEWFVNYEEAALSQHWLYASRGFRVLKAQEQYFVAVSESVSQTNSVNVIRNFYIFIIVLT